MPARLLDTRNGTGSPQAPLSGGSSIVLQVTGRGGIPATGVDAVVLNLTATNVSAPTYITAWPDGTARPVASAVTATTPGPVPDVRLSDNQGCDALARQRAWSPWIATV